MDLSAFVESNWGTVFSLVVAVVLVLAGGYAYINHQRSPLYWLLGALIGGLVIAALWGMAFRKCGFIMDQATESTSPGAVK